MKSRFFVVGLVLFFVAAALGAGFALFGPVTLIRVFGTLAFIGGAAGCALQLYALHEFAPRTYALLNRRLHLRVARVAGTMPAARSAVLATYR